MIHLRMSTANIALATLLISTIACMNADEIPWQKDFAKARRLAAEQQKPMLIHFWSESCGPCKKLDRYVFPHPEVARTVQGVVPVKINTSQQRQLAAQFGIKRIPTDVLISHDGRELWRGISPGTVNDYIGMVNRAVRQQRLAPDPTGLSQIADAARNRSLQFAGQAGSAAHAMSEKSGQGSAASDVRTNRHPQAPPEIRPSPQDSVQTRNGPGGPTNSGGAFRPEGIRPEGNTYHLSDVEPRQPQVEAGRASQFRQAANPPISQQAAVGGRGPASGQPNQNPYFNRAAAANQQQAVAASPAKPVDQAKPEHQGMDRAQPSAPPQRTDPAQPSVPFTPSAQSPSQVQQAASHPRFALEGYCPVSLVDHRRWIKGDRSWGVVHRGQTYLFSSEENLKRFWSDPDGFAPMLSGYDPVHFAERHQWIEGRRQHGVFFKDQNNGRTSIVLFADEATLAQFCRAPERYHGQIRQALQTGSQRNFR